jgi:hypothetical protein
MIAADLNGCKSEYSKNVVRLSGEASTIRLLFSDSSYYLMASQVVARESILQKLQ